MSVKILRVALAIAAMSVAMSTNVFAEQTEFKNVLESSDEINPVNYVGVYTYAGAESYIYNEQTQQYDLHATTTNNSWEEWNSKMHPGDYSIIDGGFTISNAYGDHFDFNEEYAVPFTLLKNETEWVVDVNADGVLQESEKNEKSNIELLADGRVSWSFEMHLNTTDPDDLENHSHYGWPEKGTVKIIAYFSKK